MRKSLRSSRLITNYQSRFDMEYIIEFDIGDGRRKYTVIAQSKALAEEIFKKSSFFRDYPILSSYRKDGENEND